MKLIDIPLHLQADGSDDCGPIASLMVLDHFGISSDENDVLAKVPRAYWGTSTFDNGTMLRTYGLQVEAITAHPKLFDGDFIRSKPDLAQISQRIIDVMNAEKNDSQRDILKGLMDYLDSDGTLTLAIPSKQQITDALDEDKLVLASTYADAWGKNQGVFHFVVISGYDTDKNKFFVNNPSRLSRQQSWEDSDEVMYGIHSSTIFDFDNGAILIVGK